MAFYFLLPLLRKMTSILLVEIFKVENGFGGTSTPINISLQRLSQESFLTNIGHNLYLHIHEHLPQMQKRIS
jgi:hypothetical protein